MSDTIFPDTIFPPRKVTAVWLTAALLITATTASAGPESPEGTPIETIRVEGCQTVDPTVVEGQIRTRVGDTYRQEQVSADLKRIMALGLFGNVTTATTAGERGVILTFTVVERRSVSRIVFRGNANRSEDRLLEVSGLEGLTRVDEFRLVDACRKTEEYYHDEGYAFARVVSSVEVVQGETAAVITVREGPHVRVEAITFRNVTAFSEATLRKRMETEAVLEIFPPLGPGVFREATVKEDVRQVRDFYVAQGYLNAEVSYELSFNRDRSRVTVTVLVREGEPFTVGRVEVRGATVFSAAEVIAQMALTHGARYTEATSTADTRAIAMLYGRQGYVTTQVQIERRFTTTPNVVDLRVVINEGEQVRLATIRIRGNSKTRRDVILRELRRLHPGQVLNAEGLQESRRRLLRLRYFKSVSLDRFEGTQPGEKDLVIEVEEDRTADVMFGVGVGTETGLVGSITFEQRNFDIARLPRSFEDVIEGYAFAGGGQRFRAEARPGTELQQYLVRFEEPYVFGTDFSLGVEAFLYDRVRFDYDEMRAGGNVSVGRRLTDALRAEVLLRAEHIRIDDIDREAPSDVFDVKGDSFLSAVRLAVIHDTRDDWLEPSSGHRLLASIEQAGVLAGDYTFTRLLFRAGWHIPVLFASNRDAAHILSVGGRLGFIFNDAPIFERFYAGGTYTMRGFRYRGVGPHKAGEAVGGEFMILGSAEYSLPVVPRVLRLVVFMDVGTVEEDVEFTTVRLSAGLGLRLYVGGLGPAPMQFNFGFPILKDSEDETRIFSFAVGTRL